MVKSVMMELILIILKKTIYAEAWALFYRIPTFLQARLWTISDMEDSMQLMKNV